MNAGSRYLAGVYRDPAPWLARLVLVLAMLAVYGQVIGHGMLTWDDEQHLTNNPYVNPPTWQGVGQVWRQPHWGLYIPLSYTWFAAQAVLAWQPEPGQSAGTLDPRVFHAGNLVLHVVCVLLVFGILRRLLLAAGTAVQKGGGTRPAAVTAAACAGALLFGLHPVQVESVAWISEGRGLLCAVFSLIAIGQYLRFAEGRTQPTANSPTATTVASFTNLHYLLATLALVLALLSKPAAVAVPLLAAVSMWACSAADGKTCSWPSGLGWSWRPAGRC